MADFRIIHKESFQLFNIISETPEKNTKFKRYPILFFKDKYIIFLNNNIFFIAFKRINSIKFNEIIVDFIKIKEKILKDNKNEYNKIKGSKKKLLIFYFIKIQMNGLRKLILTIVK